MDWSERHGTVDILLFVSEDLSALEPIPPLDAAELVAQVNAQAGERLELLGAAPSGQNGGAAYVRWPDGHEGVVKRSRASVQQIRRTAAALAAADGRGLPVPRYELVTELPDGVAILQTRLPGSPATRIDQPMVEATAATNERLADLLAHDREVPKLPLYLTHSGPGHCLHETLERHDSRTRQLLAAIHSIGTSSPDPVDGDDLVHLDFTAGNVLFDQTGALTGIVDWDNIARGDRRFALVQMRFDLGWANLFAARDPDNLAVHPAAISWLDAYLDRVLARQTLDAYWAHWSLHMIDRTIRHGDQESVDYHVELAADRLL